MKNNSGRGVRKLLKDILMNFEDDEEPTTSQTITEGSQSQNTIVENGERPEIEERPHCV